MSFLGGLGKVLGKVAGVASVIPGVGTVAGGALGAAGGLLGGGGLKGALSGALGGAIPGGGLVGGAGKGLAGKLLGMAPTVIGALGAAHGASQVSKGNDLMHQATQDKMKQYGALQPVRDRAIAQALLGAPKAQNLHGLYHDPTNPFGRPDASPNQPAAPAPPPPPVSSPPGQPGGFPGLPGGMPGMPMGPQGMGPRPGLAGRLLR